MLLVDPMGGTHKVNLPLDVLWVMRIHHAKFRPEWSYGLVMPMGWMLWVNPVGDTLPKYVPQVIRIQHAKFCPHRFDGLAVPTG